MKVLGVDHYCEEGNILDKYTMFNSHVDNTLIDSGFELKYDGGIYYEKICESHIFTIDALIIKITKNLVIIESVCETRGLRYHSVTRDIEDSTLVGIENKIHECISELEGKYGITTVLL